MIDRQISGHYVLHVDLTKAQLEDYLLNLEKEDRYNIDGEREIGGLHEIDLKDGEPCDIAMIVPRDLTRYSKNDVVPCEILMDEEHAKIGKANIRRVKKLVTALTKEGISVNSHRKIGTYRHSARHLLTGAIR